VAISIDWSTRVITVQQADLLQVQSSPVEVYELNLSDFHDDLRDLEDSELGIPHPDTHNYASPTTISGVTLALVVEMINNYTVTFLPNLSWAVNIVGGNSNVADVVNPNNVSVRTANSAGLQDAVSLQAASFLGHVTIDVINGVSGTTFPRGTQQTPVNNLADALTIAEQRGLFRFLVINDLTIDAGDFAQGYTFFAQIAGTTVTIDPVANVTNCSFETIGVTGTLDANNRFTACEVFNAVSLEANLIDCILTGTLTLGGGLTQLINCSSGVAGGGPSQTPTIDLGGSGSDLLVRDYSGGLALENLNDSGAAVSLDFDSGQLIVDPTVVDGAITVRGVVAYVVDNSTGSAIVNDLTITADIDFVQKLLRNRRETDPVTGQQRIYDDDNVTVLIEGNLWEDLAGTQGYQGQGADRADRMV